LQEVNIGVNLPGEVLLDGAVRRVRFAVHPGGRSSTRTEWDALPDTSRARLHAYLEYFANNNRAPNPDAYKKLADTEIWQWRHGDYRVLCCNKGRDHVICVVVEKLNQKLRSSTIDRATSVCAQDIGG
jgi:mRNA-degrading endonuclease RelE of RelBE toxin-antitoxin system